jgi:hypothetical protein
MSSDNQRPSKQELSASAKFVVKYTDELRHIIENEPVERFAKVSMKYVKKLSVERTKRLDEALKVMLGSIPSYDEMPEISVSDPGVRHLKYNVESFFLTDHVVEEGKEVPEYLKDIADNSNTNTSTASSSSEPRRGARFAMATKKRQSVVNREQTAALLTEANEIVLEEEDDDDSNTANKSKPKPALKKTSFATSPAIQSKSPSKSNNIKTGANTQKPVSFVVMAPLFLGLLVMLRRAGLATVNVSVDIEMLICFMCFALGAQFNRSFGGGSSDSESNSLEALGASHDRAAKFSNEALEEKASRAMSLAIIRKSLAVSTGPSTGHIPVLSEMSQELEAELLLEDEDELIGVDAKLLSPLRTFPQGGNPTTEENCVDTAPAEDYHVRGPTYLVDKVKVPSAPIIFPFRGADFFLTDDGPENVARYVTHILDALE